MAKITMYITDAHSSITVVDKVSRETSSKYVNELVEAMHPDDRQAVAELCQHILAAMPKKAERLIS